MQTQALNNTNKVISLLLRLVSAVIMALNLHYIWSVYVFPTMDGPAHVYNSTLLGMIAGSEFIQSFLEINYWFLPNYFPHYLLLGLQNFFTPFVSEKLLVSMIVVLLPLSFHRVCRVWGGDPDAGFLMNVLACCGFVYLGFYNFMLGFVFINLQLILLARFIRYEKPGFLNLGLMLLVIFLTYYTHPFCFGILCLLSFLAVVFASEESWRARFIKLVVLSLLLLPAFIFFLLFRSKVHIADYSHALPDPSFTQKLMALADFSLGVIYVHDTEKGPARVFVIVLLLLLLYQLVFRRGFFSRMSTLMGISAMISLLLYFILPDGMLGAMFGLRMSFVLFFFLALCVGLHKAHNKWILLIAAMAILVSYQMCLELRAPHMKQLSRSALEAVKAGPYVPPRAVVYAVNFSPIANEAHYSNYALIGREAIVNENYEATLGWFPLKWKEYRYLIRYKPEPDNPVVTAATHMLVCGDHNGLKDERGAQIGRFIEDSCSLLYRSERNFCSLYRINR